jgi:subtilase family serine protease
MKGLLNKAGRNVPVRFFGSAINRRKLGTMLLGGVLSASLLLASSTVFAELTTIELSPLVAKSTYIAPLDKNKEIGVVLAVPSSDLEGLKTMVKHVSTSGDPLFHKYLTAQEFAERFGGNQADYTALKNWATANGLVISQESIGRLGLTVRGSVLKFETLFKTQLNTYRASDGESFYSASTKPTVPAEISSKVSGVIGLTSSKARAPLAKVVKALGEEPAPHSATIRTDSAGGTGPGGTYSCVDLRAAYQMPQWGSREKGMIVGVFEQGYYNPADVKKYFTTFGIPKTVKQNAISVDGSPVTVEGEIEVEACLDLDMIVGMNPSISEVKVYIDDYTHDPFDVAMVDAFAAMADDTTPCQVVSVSYGQDEGYFGSSAESAEDSYTLQLAIEGITVFASSGDSGAYGNGYYYPYNVSCPAVDPYVTGVGGTTLFTIFGNNYYSENAWNELPNFGATGGGVSTYWGLPYYQDSLVGGTGYVTANGGSSTYRNVPDVAAVGDPLTGVGVYVSDQGGWLQVGGTSASSPIWAGYVTNINAAFYSSGLGHLGYFNPILYSVGTQEIGYGYPASWLFDIVTGSNGNAVYYGYPGYTNGPGYSNTTGNGSIWGGGFALQLLISGTQAGTRPGGFNVSVKGVPKATSTTIQWSPASTGASGYAIGLYQYGYGAYYVTHAFLAGPTAKTHTFTGLTPNTAYWVYMWGYNASGGSPDAYTSWTTATN